MEVKAGMIDRVTWMSTFRRSNILDLETDMTVVIG